MQHWYIQYASVFLYEQLQENIYFLLRTEGQNISGYEDSVKQEFDFLLI